MPSVHIADKQLYRNELTQQVWHLCGTDLMMSMTDKHLQHILVVVFVHVNQDAAVGIDFR